MRKIFCILLILFVFLMSFNFSYAQQQKISKEDDFVILAREFVDLLSKGNFLEATKNFNNQMKSVSSGKLRGLWETLTRQLGDFKNQGSVRTIRHQQYHIVFVTCKFEKSFIDVKIVFNSARLIAGLFFVPSKPVVHYYHPGYIKSGSFKEKEVTVGKGEWAIPGTLTIPTGKGPFPAIIFIHGSGPHDRDETLGPNKPFRDLSWGLASQGVANLRYDKRTKVHTAKFGPIKDNITVKEEVIDDALAAVSLLRGAQGIDTKRIFLLGHSLGGMLIPRIGLLDSDIAGFIVMAGSTRPLEDVYLEQVSYIFSLDGTISEDEKMQLEQIKAQVTRVKDPQLSESTPSANLPLGVSAEYWLDLRGYNPAELAENLRQPMLILQGARDYQVTLDDFQIWEKVLSSRENVQFKIYPKLNHLFIEGEERSTPEEYLTAGHVAEVVIDDIANWVKKQVL